jgi:putative ABC transport system ATP-binding protein
VSTVLDLRRVTKSYGEGAHTVEVLRGIDLRVERGEFVAVVGPSGSGKSTLLNVLGCLDRPTTGNYFFEGDDAAQLDDLRLSRLRNGRIGFVFQSFMLVPHLSVRENVELPMMYARTGRTQRRVRCAHLIEQVGLSHRATHKPNQLSGGECQRVAIARALANDPAMLLADEPTGNLDSKTSASILKLIGDLHQSGRTVVMITHAPEIAAQAPRRVAIRDGVIHEDTAVALAGAGAT